MKAEVKHLNQNPLEELYIDKEKFLKGCIVIYPSWEEKQAVIDFLKIHGFGVRGGLENGGIAVFPNPLKIKCLKK